VAYQFDYYYNTQNQIVEVQSLGGSGFTTYEQFVWDSRYIDAPVMRHRTQGTLNETVYYLQDVNWNTVAIVDTTGTVLERYVYDAYGNVTYYSGTWGADTPSNYNNNVLYAGYFFEADPSVGSLYQLGIYFARNRFYHQTLGRWFQRDPMGYKDSMNLYEYVASHPTMVTDPEGTDILYLGIPPSPPRRGSCKQDAGWPGIFFRHPAAATNPDPAPDPSPDPNGIGGCTQTKMDTVDNALKDARDRTKKALDFLAAAGNAENAQKAPNSEIPNLRYRDYFYKTRNQWQGPGRDAANETAYARVVEVVTKLDGLDPSITCDCPHPNDPDTGRPRYGYRDKDDVIHICPLFFSTNTNQEQRTRTLIHEMAHVAGAHFRPEVYSEEGCRHLPLKDAVENASNYEYFIYRGFLPPAK
jgi:RHS repeat-associated protein